MDRRLG